VEYLLFMCFILLCNFCRIFFSSAIYPLALWCLEGLIEKNYTSIKQDGGSYDQDLYLWTHQYEAGVLANESLRLVRLMYFNPFSIDNVCIIL
jgi:hypothetical protein